MNPVVIPWCVVENRAAERIVAETLNIHFASAPGHRTSSSHLQLPPPPPLPQFEELSNFEASILNLKAPLPEKAACDVLSSFMG